MTIKQQERLRVLLAEGKTLAWRDPQDGRFHPIRAIAEMDDEPVALFDDRTGWASLLASLPEDFYVIAPVFPS